MNTNQLYEIEDFLIENEESALIGRLAGSVTHEVSTPLGLGVMGVSHIKEKISHLKKLYESEEMSEEDFENFLTSASELCDSTEESLKKAATLINNFKDMASQQNSLQISHFNLYEYINEILLNLRNQLKKKKYNLILNFDKNLMIKSYAGLISLILTNFIQNSIEHGFKDHNSGDIIIDIKKDNDLVTLIYKDSGEGIDKVTQECMFEPFFSTQTDSKGLGLYGVQSVVQHWLKGTIECNSTPKQGAEFIIKFKEST
jgi:signal transduction histidine kinase